MLGQPLFDTELLATSNEDAKQISIGFQRSTAEINFVRNRMLYARPALNARGLVHFGLRHIREWSMCRSNKHALSNQPQMC